MMRTRLALLAAGAAVALAGSALQAQGAERNTWSGIFSTAQAERGRASYATNCGGCHGATLSGTGEAPGLVGGEFLSAWNGLSVGDLFDRIRTTMPFDRPNTLSREVYADTLAFLLTANGFPAGQSELSGRSEMLAAIPFITAKPVAALSPAPALQRVAMLIDQGPSAPSSDPNSYPNPYNTVENYLQLPPGRTMGSSSSVAVDRAGHIWVVDRCGVNNCSGSTFDPVMEFAADGHFLRAWGKGMFLFPHGLTIDRDDNLWIVDGHAEGAKGFQVVKMSHDGRVLLTLGKPGVAGSGPGEFNEPNAVLVAPNGSIFVSEGHTAYKTSARIQKFDRTGKFVAQWGTHGNAPGEIEVPHTLAMDSRGRLFVGDRWNDRIQIYDQNGKLLDSWTQFGRPSGLYIDRNDTLYAADSESRVPQGYGYHPGWKRGIRIGSARTGRVTGFIPDTFATPDASSTSGAEGIWVDNRGVIYGAQVQQKAIVRYTRK